MIDKIKYFFIGVGILSLIAIFYITGQKLQLNKLQNLLNKNYNKKLQELETEKARLREGVKVSRGIVRTELKATIKNLNTKKREIKKNVKNLKTDDLSIAIDSWFKSRK
tara:strand:+ start:3815 stop:4141 length:327 start_codon:yes stop_codon:yes gene_type:complete